MLSQQWMCGSRTITKAEMITLVCQFRPLESDSVTGQNFWNPEGQVAHWLEVLKLIHQPGTWHWCFITHTLHTVHTYYYMKKTDHSRKYRKWIYSQSTGGMPYWRENSWGYVPLLGFVDMNFERLVVAVLSWSSNLAIVSSKKVTLVHSNELQTRHRHFCVLCTRHAARTIRFV